MSHLTLIQAHTVRIRNWTDHGELHRMVMGLFASTSLPGPAIEKRLSSNILFRVDDTSTGKIILVRSDLAPTNLPREAQTKPVIIDAPPTGTAIRFRMTVNAIRRSKPLDPTIKRGKGITPVDDIASWVTERLGIAMEDLTIFTHDRAVVTSGKSPLQIDKIDGYALVRDQTTLETSLREGVGRAKAFGCGLLTIARA